MALLFLLLAGALLYVAWAVLQVPRALELATSAGRTLVGLSRRLERLEERLALLEITGPDASVSRPVGGVDRVDLVDAVDACSMPRPASAAAPLNDPVPPPPPTPTSYSNCNPPPTPTLTHSHTHTPTHSLNRLLPLSPEPAPAPSSNGSIPPGWTWEARIGGQWLGWLASVTVVFAVGLFLKWAYDMGWITPLFHLPPLAYLVLGWSAGLGLLGAGEVQRRRLPALAQGLTGAGIAVLYLTTYAGHALYRVLTPGAATFGLALVSAAAIAAALRHDSLAIGWIGIVLAYASPVLLGGGPSPAPLFLYVTALNAGVLGISVVRQWSGFRAAAFAATALLYGAWHLRGGTGPFVGEALGFLGANSAIFLAVLALYPIRFREPSRDSDLAVAVLNPFLSGLAVYSLLQPRHTGVLGVVALAVAAVYTVLARAIRARRGEEDYLEQLFFATALVFLLLAAPLHFGGRSRLLGASWGLAGAALFVVGSATHSRRTRGWGGAALVLCLIRLASWDAWTPPAGGAPHFFNERGFSFAAALLSAGVIAALIAREWADGERRDDGRERLLALLAGTMAVVLDVWVRLDMPAGWTSAGYAAVAGLALAFGMQARSPRVRGMAHVFALLPLTLEGVSPALQLLSGGWRPGTPWPAAGWLATLGLFLSAAAAYEVASPERAPERWLRALYAAAAALLLLVRSAAELPVTWIPFAWALVGAAALGAGFGLRAPGYRRAGDAVSSLCGAYLLTHQVAGAMAPVERAPGLLAGILLGAGAALAYIRSGRVGWAEAALLGPASAGLAAVLAMGWAWAVLGPGWLTLAWAGVALALLAAGVALEKRDLRAQAVLVAAAVSAEAVLREWTLPAAHAAVVHSRSAALLAALGVWVVLAWGLARHGEEAERSVVPWLAGIASLHALAWLSVEAADVAGRIGPAGWAREASQFALSAVWAAYAAAAIGVGFRRELRAARLGGMALLLVAVAKVYLYDLGFLALGYRVLSFLVLAGVLFGVSYVYQRRAAPAP